MLSTLYKHLGKKQSSKHDDYNPPLNNSRQNTHIGRSDRLFLVTFNDYGKVHCKPLEPHNPILERTIKHLRRHVCGEYTNIADGMKCGIEVLEKSPPGVHRRMWVLTDGYANKAKGGIYKLLPRAYESHININTVGFGDVFDERLLKVIACNTHNGKFFTAQSLIELTKIFTQSTRRTPRTHRRRPETTAYVIDCSGSMILQRMGKDVKIDVVSKALLQLLRHKQQTFS